MKNIDKLREMSVKELAAFLDDECGAEVPPEFCERCDECRNHEKDVCKYKDESDAWEAWLEMEES